MEGERGVPAWCTSPVLEYVGLELHLRWIWDAYWTLAGSRSMGGGILYSEMCCYMDRHDITDEQQFVWLINEMDGEYMSEDK